MEYSRLQRSNGLLNLPAVGKNSTRSHSPLELNSESAFGKKFLPISITTDLFSSKSSPPDYNNNDLESTAKKLTTDLLPSIAPIPTTPLPVCKFCKLYPSVIKTIRFLWPYQDQARNLIVAMKYRPCRSICSSLAQSLSEHSRQLGLINFNYPPDTIAPIPITRGSYNSRKFHQTGLLAKIITKLNKTLPPVTINLLKTSQNKAPQASLKHSARLRNVSGSFQVNMNVNRQSILLVEDVITTGATISAAAHALLEAGAKSVSVIALARSSTWETHRFANYRQFSLTSIQT